MYVHVYIDREEKGGTRSDWQEQLAATTVTGREMDRTDWRNGCFATMPSMYMDQKLHRPNTLTMEDGL